MHLAHLFLARLLVIDRSQNEKIKTAKLFIVIIIIIIIILKVIISINASKMKNKNNTFNSCLTEIKLKKKYLNQS